MAKILFVDDEQFILSGMKRIFKLMASELDVIFASSGREALDFLKNNEFDMIISDMYMPEITGLELLSSAKEIQPNSIRIMLSGYLESTIDSPQRQVAHLTLSKPIKTEVFIDTIRNCLTHKEQFIEQ